MAILAGTVGFMFVTYFVFSNVVIGKKNKSLDYYKRTLEEQTHVLEQLEVNNEELMKHLQQRI